jgi:voltage-gated potassium channel
MNDAVTLKDRIWSLYFGKGDSARTFRIAMLIFDLVTVIFLVASSFYRGVASESVDTLIGIVILADFLARLWVDDRPWAYLRKPATIADMLVIISLLAPFVGEGLAFLRVFRVARLLRSEWVFELLEERYPRLKRSQETIHASVNLTVFLFVMTAIVYETQHRTNEKIGDYLDALYFTVTTLTTTGFGDITLQGDFGKLLSVIIMIFGVSLFVRLIQVMVRAPKAYHPCPQCGLERHDFDAVHCKACGIVVNIRDEGAH